MGFAKIRGPLTSRIGQQVRFGAPKYPIGAKPEVGVVVDEVWADTTVNCSPVRPARSSSDWGDYSFFAQLIRWQKDPAEHSIRLGYYRRRPDEDHWEFAGQMTINSDWRTIKRLLENTLEKHWWFADDPQNPNAVT